MADRTNVSAGDFIRNFGMWQQRAMVQPIGITNHGRERLILHAIDLPCDAGDAVGSRTGHHAVG